MVGAVAYIFPGQGAQYAGMGKDLYEKSLPAREVFDKADSILGFSISRLCFEGPQEKLSQTLYAQPALLTAAIAALEALKTSVKCQVSNVKYAAGLSLGEYSALVAAGAVDFESALRLVKRRAELMAEAAEKYPGKMLAVIGLDAQIIENLCRLADIEVANRNCPGQVVVTGKKENVDKFAALAGERGAKRLVELDVSGAFHSRLMQEAGLNLKRELERIDIKLPRFNVVSNVTAIPFSSIDDIRKNLSLQVSSSVLWEASVRYMVSRGVGSFLEIGPGKVLKGLLRKIGPGLEVVNIEKMEDILNLAK